MIFHDDEINAVKTPSANEEKENKEENAVKKMSDLTKLIIGILTILTLTASAFAAVKAMDNPQIEKDYILKDTVKKADNNKLRIERLKERNDLEHDQLKKNVNEIKISIVEQKGDIKEIKKALEILLKRTK